MKHVCIFLIELYRKYVSPLKRRPSCRFYPSCSCYAVDAYRMHGFFGGTYLAVTRILRCNPLCKGGIDPVPQKIVFGKKSTSDSKKNGE